LNSIKNEGFENVNYIQLDFEGNFLNHLMDLFFHQNINSLMVEGGSFTLNEFIEANLFDEIHRYKSKKNYLESGVLPPTVKGNQISSMELPNDYYEVFKNNTTP
jgi:diaminohydroxyphosphoribosylaminopyrimidine deaminase/5-amino-6-(5-phosphoribosylamino)uracil reductase